MRRSNEWIEISEEQIQAVQREIIAFLNTNGGTIYIGMSNKGAVLGIKNIEEVTQMIQNALQNDMKPDVMPYVRLKKIYPNQKPIIVIDVQRGLARPYFLVAYGLTPKGVFIGTNSSPATQEAIHQMIAETDGESFEKRRALNQVLTFHELEQHVKTPLDKEQLQTLGLINLDDLYTNLAFLVSDQCDYGISVAIFEEDNFVQKQNFKGSVLKQLKEVTLYLKSIVKEAYLEPILEEVLINAIIHRCYQMKQDIFINLYPHCFEVISLGGFIKKITLNDVLQGLSVYRNPDLVQLFAKLNLIKAHGTGLRMILKAYQAYNRHPEFYVTSNSFKVILPSLALCKEKSPKMTAPYSLEKKDNDVLQLIQSQGPISRAEIEKQLELKKHTVMCSLKRLKQAEKIMAIGKGRGIQYIELKE